MNRSVRDNHTFEMLGDDCPLKARVRIGDSAIFLGSPVSMGMIRGFQNSKSQMLVLNHKSQNRHQPQQATMPEAQVEGLPSQKF